MLNKNNFTQVLVILGAVFSIGCVLNQPAKEYKRPFLMVEQKVNIANLANGNYQFCSQPDPQDWRDGAGVCANFQKRENRFDGYYGYPHSDSFICIRGDIKDNLIAGKALSILWTDEQNNIATSAFKWDLEERLTLSQGNFISAANNQDDVQWIVYGQALLNLEGFYQYNRPRMTPVSQLCKWN